MIRRVWLKGSPPESLAEEEQLEAELHQARENSVWGFGHDPEQVALIKAHLRAKAQLRDEKAKGEAAKLPAEAATAQSAAAKSQAVAQATCEKPGCSNPGGKKCARCMKATYCSKECQTAHWKGGHKSACAPR
jgi:hypothetical protein